MSRREMGERLEMLLVMHWLDEGAAEDGRVALSVPTAAVELGLGGGREGVLAVMGALGDLEDRKLVSVAWPGAHAGGEAIVGLSAELRHDARKLFGRT